MGVRKSLPDQLLYCIRSNQTSIMGNLWTLIRFFAYHCICTVLYDMFNILLHPCPPLHLGTGPPWATSSSPWSTPLPPSAPSSSSLCSLSLSRRYLACSFLGPNSTQTKRGARLTRSTSPASRSFRFGGFWIQRDSVASLGLVCHLFSGCIAGLRLCMWLHITSLLIRLTVTFTFSFQVNG